MGDSKILPLVFPNPLNFFTPKFAQMITFSISPDVQNLVKIRLWEASPRMVCLFFPSLSFFFLPSSTGKTTELILTHDGSYDAVSRKKVPFGGYKI